MNIIKYENEDEQLISVQQKDALSKYYKTYIINGLPKKKEFYKEGEIIDVIFYKETETVNQIFILYPDIISFDIRERTVVGNYFQVENKSYLNGVLKHLEVFIIDIHGNMIYSDERDISTGIIVTKESSKYYYINNDFSKFCTFYYKSNGEVLEMYNEFAIRIRWDHLPSYFDGEWQNMTYYHNTTPLTP